MPVRRRALTAKLSLLLAAMSGVCLAQFPPPSDSGQYAAKVLTMSGQVSVRVDRIDYALTEGSTVQVQQMIVTGPDGHATFQVSDGSTFEVFPGSFLVFRKNAWNVKDLIDLLVGRIRVHIEHLGNIPNPNRILTPTAVISVRGTTFDVTVGEDDETTTVEVEEGLVEVRHALLPSEHVKMLGAGDSVKVYKSQPLEASMWDKGTIWRFALKAVQDAANLASMRGTRGVLGTSGSGSSGSGSVGVGDTGKTQAPAPPPPPPPPPPHYRDAGSAADPDDPNTASAPPKPPKLRSAVHSVAKYSLQLLREMTGINPPTFSPLEVRRHF
jgi:hypothetical protein